MRKPFLRIPPLAYRMTTNLRLVMNGGNWLGELIHTALQLHTVVLA